MTTLAALNLRLSQIKDEIYSLNENMTAEKIKSDFLKQEMSEIEKEIELEKNKDRFYVGEVFLGVLRSSPKTPYILIWVGDARFSLCNLETGRYYDTIVLYYCGKDNGRLYLRPSEFQKLLSLNSSNPIEEVSKTRYKSAKDYYRNVFFGDHSLFCTEGSHGDRYYF